ncbi:MAG: hypothetical protein KY459_11260 [Acidobacteria bacterium]|nr:hypothetical protein [Acidobacteriota bacterium]
MKPSMILLVSAIVIEVAAIVLIVKSIVTDSSPTLGIIFLAVGMTMLVIGLATRSKKTD